MLLILVVALRTLILTFTDILIVQIMLFKLALDESYLLTFSFCKPIVEIRSVILELFFGFILLGL